jgi:hypothetical protein
VIQTRNNLSSAIPLVRPRNSNYFGTGAHYEAVAHRIVTALRCGNRPFVLVAGDPPADPQALADALGNVVGFGYAVIIISCGPDLRHEDLKHLMLAKPASPLFVLDAFDRLSDRQIEDVCEDASRGDPTHWAAVLLVRVDFLALLERPALRFLKERIATQFRFEEVGDDEAIAILHNQLLSQRDRRIEARGFRRGILVGLAAGGAAIAAGIGAFILRSTTERVWEAPATTGSGGAASEQSPLPQPGGEPAASIVPEQTAREMATASALVTAPPSASTPPPLSATVEDQSGAAPPPPAHPRSAPRLSNAEIVGLVARGDTFFSAGDITSARLFYERAAEADSGLAALQLGGTFDPMVLTRARVHGVTADPAQALTWYRRARELGVSEAGQRIKALAVRQGE